MGFDIKQEDIAMYQGKWLLFVVQENKGDKPSILNLSNKISFYEEKN